MLSIGNGFALIALLAWPVVVGVMFRTLSPERALIWSILGAYMFLPQGSEINLPGIPAFNKVTIPNLAALVGCMIVLGRFPGLLPRSLAGRILLIMLALSPSITVLNNLDPVRFGLLQFGTLEVLVPDNLERMELPGLRLYDSASALAGQLLILLPFFLAREVLRTEQALREMLLALVIAAFIYALPMLFEARFSPQLHTLVYGFFQHDFLQSIRDSGYRPFVFMPHGLWVALFAVTSTLSAAALLKMAPAKQRGRWLLGTVCLFGLVMLCKSLGPLLLAVVFAPLMLLLGSRGRLAIAAMIAVVVISYPLLRGSGLIPTQALVKTAREINPERAVSLQYRFDNEDQVLAHAAEKLLFGWGGWGRFVPHDPATGATRIVVDGQWIITIGHYGWMGYIALFGLLTLPLFALWWHGRKATAPPVPLAASAVALILAVNLLDLMPNGTLIPFTWLMAGAVLGYAEALGRDAKLNRARHQRRAHALVPEPSRDRVRSVL